MVRAWQLPWVGVGRRDAARIPVLGHRSALGTLRLMRVEFSVQVLDVRVGFGCRHTLQIRIGPVLMQSLA